MKNVTKIYINRERRKIFFTPVSVSFPMGLQHPSTLNGGKLIDQSNDLCKFKFKKPLFNWLTNQLTISKHVTNQILLNHNLC